MELANGLFRLLRVVNFHIVYFDRVARVETNDASSLDQFLINQALEHDLSILEEFLGFFTDCLVVENLWVGSIRVFAPDLPGREEGVPIDVRKHFVQVKVLEDPCA